MTDLPDSDTNNAANTIPDTIPASDTIPTIPTTTYVPTFTNDIPTDHIPIFTNSSSASVPNTVLSTVTTGILPANIGNAYDPNILQTGTSYDPGGYADARHIPPAQPYLEGAMDDEEEDAILAEAEAQPIPDSIGQARDVYVLIDDPSKPPITNEHARARYPDVWIATESGQPTLRMPYTAGAVRYRYCP